MGERTEAQRRRGLCSIRPTAFAPILAADGGHRRTRYGDSWNDHGRLEMDSRRVYESWARFSARLSSAKQEIAKSPRKLTTPGVLRNPPGGRCYLFEGKQRPSVQQPP